MRIYVKPEAAEFDSRIQFVLCDSLTSTTIDDFTESEDIEW